MRSWKEILHSLAFVLLGAFIALSFPKSECEKCLKASGSLRELKDSVTKLRETSASSREAHAKLEEEYRSRITSMDASLEFSHKVARVMMIQYSEIQDAGVIPREMADRHRVEMEGLIKVGEDIENNE